MADTVCLHTGEVHLKEGKVRELLLEIPSIRPDSVVLCVAIHSNGGPSQRCGWVILHDIL